MTKHLGFLSLIIFISFTSCQQKVTSDTTDMIDLNPPSEGFNLEDSDSIAISIADKVMDAMGGRANWDATQFLTWNFFGRRFHTWDRYQGRDSIFILKDSTVIDFNINTLEGEVYKYGIQVIEPDSVKNYIEFGHKLWINDSYWLVMPFKLKDSGVTLKYLGNENNQAKTPCHKLQLTFNEVGVTPENKYEVFIDTTSYLISQWNYFQEFSMDTPNISTPWNNYQLHGNILLSGNRGKFQLTDIAVLKDWP